MKASVARRSPDFEYRLESPRLAPGRHGHQQQRPESPRLAPTQQKHQQQRLESPRLAPTQQKHQQQRLESPRLAPVPRDTLRSSSLRSCGACGPGVPGATRPLSFPPCRLGRSAHPCRLVGWAHPCRLLGSALLSAGRVGASLSAGRVGASLSAGRVAHPCRLVGWAHPCRLVGPASCYIGQPPPPQPIALLVARTSLLWCSSLARVSRARHRYRKSKIGRSAPESKNQPSSCRTVSTGRGQVRTTRSATEPIRNRFSPWRPRVPVATMSASTSRA